MNLHGLLRCTVLREAPRVYDYFALLKSRDLSVSPSGIAGARAGV